MSLEVKQFRNRIVSAVPGCPIPLIDSEVVNAIRTLCEDTRCIQKPVGATGTPSDAGAFYKLAIDLYTWDSLDGYEVIEPILFNLEQCNYFPFEIDPDSNVDVSQLIPEEHLGYRIVDDETFELFPFDDDTEVDLIVTFALKVSLGVTSVDTVFYNKYRDAIISQSLYCLQKMPGRPWTDLKQAGINLDMYNDEKGKIRITTKRHLHTIRGGYF
jgi:hypothetical protein